MILALAACSATASASTFADQLAANEQRHGVVGQAVLVLRDDRVLFRGARGVADVASHRPIAVDDVFPVFSVTKLFTSTLVLRLIERGDVDPAQPISRYVADLPERWRAVTVQQLLDHVSGLPDSFEAGRTTSFPPTLDQRQRRERVDAHPDRERDADRDQVELTRVHRRARSWILGSCGTVLNARSSWLASR